MIDRPRMTWKQRALERAMSEISEQCYAASWLHNTEYILWHMLANPTTPHEWGMGVVEVWQLEELKEMAAEIDGWIAWDHGDEPRYVPMDEWLAMFKRKWK